MIEFVTPREGAFGASDMADFVGFDGQQATEFGDEPPRSPWLLAVAAIVVTALIGAGIIAAAPWDGAPESAPTTTIAAVAPTPATTPAIVTTGDATPVTTRGPAQDQFDGVPTEPAGMLLDNPGDLQLNWVYSDPTAAANSFDNMLELDVWAMPGATRSTGRWLAIAVADPSRRFRSMVGDAIRVDLDGRAAVLGTSADGVFTLSVTTSDGSRLEMTGSGFAIDELARIAETVQVRTSGIDYGYLTGSGGPLELFPQPISALASVFDNLAAAAFGRVEASVSYVDRYRLKYVAVLVAPRPQQAATLTEFLLPPWPAAIAQGIERTTVVRSADGTERLVTLGSLPAQGINAIAQWTENDRVITVLGTDVTPLELFALAADTRSAGADEWRDLAIRSSNGQLHVDVTPMAASTSVGAGTLADGATWQAEARPGWLEVYGDDFGGQVILDAGPEPALRTYSTGEATFVVATSAWPAGVERSLRVQLSTIVDGVAVPLEPVVVSMVQIGETTDYVAVHGFSELADGVAEIVDANGTIVATLDL